MRNSQELEDILRIIKHEILKAQRPAEEVIFDDIDLQNFLKCSKRQTAELRDRTVIYILKTRWKSSLSIE